MRPARVLPSSSNVVCCLVCRSDVPPWPTLSGENDSGDDVSQSDGWVQQNILNHNVPRNQFGNTTLPPGGGAMQDDIDVPFRPGRPLHCHGMVSSWTVLLEGRRMRGKSEWTVDVTQNTTERHPRAFHDTRASTSPTTPPLASVPTSHSQRRAWPLSDVSDVIKVALRPASHSSGSAGTTVNRGPSSVTGFDGSEPVGSPKHDGERAQSARRVQGSNHLHVDVQRHRWGPDRH